jgi:hypothetical protein
MAGEHTYCRYMLKHAQEEAKERAVKIPQLIVDTSSPMGNRPPYHYVREREGRRLLWEGGACCKWSARSRGIRTLLSESCL